jgi:hypothetical protein
MNPLFFRSEIGEHYSDEFERIMFFNLQQKRYSKNIASVIGTFGVPRITNQDGKIRIAIDGLPDCQTIAAFDSDGPDAALLAVMVFFRKSIEDVIVLHVAVTEECSQRGVYSDELVVPRLLAAFFENMRKVAGVQRISIAYGGDQKRPTILPLHRLESASSR